MRRAQRPLTTPLNHTILPMLDSSSRRFLGGALVGAGLAGAAWLADARQRSTYARLLHRTLVDVLLNALTADDAVTARHSRRVADLTHVLAHATRLHRRERATLRVAALLHDMGKVDDRFFDILHSRGSLTKEQRAEMRTHPRESANILDPLEKFHPGIKAIVSSHHECWNGTGYPCGLHGDAIPFGARLIAVADVFDALSQPRAYKSPLSPEDALGEVMAGAGSHFDPGVVRLLERPEVWRRWREIAVKGRAEEEAEAPTGGDAPAPLESRGGGAG